jgi:hypothetical protein
MKFGFLEPGYFCWQAFMQISYSVLQVFSE